MAEPGQPEDVDATQRLKELVLGKPRELRDPRIFHSIACGDGLVDQFLQFLARFEVRDLFRRDLDSLTGFGIAAGP